MLAVWSRGSRKCWFKLPVNVFNVFSPQHHSTCCANEAPHASPYLYIAPQMPQCISAFYTFSTTSLSMSGLTRRTVLRVSVARLAVQWWAATFMRYVIFKQRQVVDYCSFAEAVSGKLANISTVPSTHTMFMNHFRS